MPRKNRKKKSRSREDGSPSLSPSKTFHTDEGPSNTESEIKKSPRQASAGSLINSPNKEGGRENVDKRRSESAKRRTNEEEKEDKLGDTPKISEVFASLDASSHGECIKIIENIDELEEENINSRNIVAPTPLILEKKHRDIIEDRELSEGISLTGDILSNVATIGSIEETQSKTKEAEEVLQSIVEAQKEEEEWGRKKTQEQNEGEGQGDLYYYPGYGGYPPEEDKGERGNIFQDGHHAPFTYLHHQGHDHLHQLSPDDHIPFKDNSPGMKGHTQINTISSTQLHQIIPTTQNKTWTKKKRAILLFGIATSVLAIGIFAFKRLKRYPHKHI